MDPIINISFNKTPMTWLIIHYFVLHTYYSVMKVIFHHQTLTSLQKHCPKKNTTPCTVFYLKNCNLPKGTIVYTINL